MRIWLHSKIDLFVEQFATRAHMIDGHKLVSTHSPCFALSCFTSKFSAWWIHRCVCAPFYLGFKANQPQSLHVAGPNRVRNQKWGRLCNGLSPNGFSVLNHEKLFTFRRGAESNRVDVSPGREPCSLAHQAAGKVQPSVGVSQEAGCWGVPSDRSFATGDF